MRTRRSRRKKSLGQNFIADQRIAARIVRAAEVGPEDTVLEIGPGSGTLTGRLAEKAGRLIGIEIDERFCELLRGKFAAEENVEIRCEDIRGTWLPALTPENGGLTVVGAIPYHLTSPIILKLVKTEADIRVAVLVVQREVGERMVAPPGSKRYGLMSIFVAARFGAEVVGVLPPEVFKPSPKVESAIVRLRPFDEVPFGLEEQDEVFRMAKVCFSQRRKMLLNSVGAFLGGKRGKRLDAADRAALGRYLESMGINPKDRPEDLSVAQFHRMVLMLRQMTELELEGGDKS